MSEALWLAIIQFATKFGLDAALAIMGAIKNAKTLEEAIAALETAKSKTAQEYLAEAGG